MVEFREIRNSKCSSSEYMRRLFAIFMGENWVWFVFPLLGLLSLSVLNVDFVIVALMAIFIVIPMVLTLLYFNYALTDEARLSISKTYIKLKDEGLVVNRLKDSDAESQLSEADNKETVVVESKEYGWNEFSGMIVGSWGVALRHEGRYRLFLIPEGAFDNEIHKASCISFIKKRMRY